MKSYPSSNDRITRRIFNGSAFFALILATLPGSIIANEPYTLPVHLEKGCPEVILPSTESLTVGMWVTGLGITSNTRIVSITPGKGTRDHTLTMSAPATISGDVNLLVGQNDQYIAALTNGSPNIRLQSTAGVSAGMTIEGAGIPAGTQVTAVLNMTTLRLSRAPTMTGTSMIVTIKPKASTLAFNVVLMSGSTAARTMSTANLSPGMKVVGAGIAPGTTITSILGAPLVSFFHSLQRRVVP